VFESIGSSPITVLEPRFTTWYVRIAASPLVVAYNPGGPDGSELAQTALHLPAGTATKVLAPSNPSEIFAETALDARLEAGQLDAASAFLSQAVQLHLHYITLLATVDFGDPSLAPAYAKATVLLSGGKYVHGVPLVVDVTTIGHTDVAAAAAFERGLRLMNREVGSEARSLLEAEAARCGLPLAAMPGAGTAATAPHDRSSTRVTDPDV
jgi:molybdate/tungstate transport system substrate-binding protein